MLDSPFIPHSTLTTHPHLHPSLVPPHSSPLPSLSSPLTPHSSPSLTILILHSSLLTLIPHSSPSLLTLPPDRCVSLFQCSPELALSAVKILQVVATYHKAVADLIYGMTSDQVGDVCDDSNPLCVCVVHSCDLLLCAYFFAHF